MINKLKKWQSGLHGKSQSLDRRKVKRKNNNFQVHMRVQRLEGHFYLDNIKWEMWRFLSRKFMLFPTLLRGLVMLEELGTVWWHLNTTIWTRQRGNFWMNVRDHILHLWNMFQMKGKVLLCLYLTGIRALRICLRLNISKL